MRKSIIRLIVAASAAGAMPATAQGVYIGPNGIGVDPGGRSGGYDRDREDRGYDQGRRGYEDQSTYREDRRRSRQERDDY